MCVNGGCLLEGLERGYGSTRIAIIEGPHRLCIWIEAPGLPVLCGVIGTRPIMIRCEEGLHSLQDSTSLKDRL